MGLFGKKEGSSKITAKMPAAGSEDSSTAADQPTSGPDEVLTPLQAIMWGRVSTLGIIEERFDQQLTSLEKTTLREAQWILVEHFALHALVPSHEPERPREGEGAVERALRTGAVKG